MDRERTRTTSGTHSQRRLSTTGSSLYGIMGLDKTATPEDIKRAYRKLALKYHPDKNPDNPAAAEVFKEINKANAILSDERKKRIYDAYGSLGLHAADTIGEENMAAYLLSQNKCFRYLIMCCFFISGCCCCCGCFCCCCCFCCGRAKPPSDEEFANFADDLRDEDRIHVEPDTNDTMTNKAEPPVITVQPTSHSGHDGSSPIPERPTIIAMPPPPKQERASPSPPPPEYDEKVPLKSTPSPRQSPTKTAQQKAGEQKPYSGNYEESETSVNFSYGSTTTSDASKSTVRDG